MHTRRVPVLLAATLVLLAACGGDDDSSPTTVAPDPTAPAVTTTAAPGPTGPAVTTTAAPGPTAVADMTTSTVAGSVAPRTTSVVATASTRVTSTTVVAPADFATALTDRLADEWGDAELARSVVGSVGPDALAALEEKLAGADPATTDLLAYRPPTASAGVIDSVIVFAFGYREQADGSRLPGTVNAELAAATAAFVADHPVPVFAQSEIAQILVAQGVPDVVSIDPDVDADGTVVYLSTVGVTDKVKAFAADAGIDLGHVGVLGFADHAMRCVLTVRAGGLTADVPDSVVLPDTYDAESGQPWTRDRAAYLGADLIARAYTL